MFFNFLHVYVFDLFPNNTEGPRISVVKLVSELGRTMENQQTDKLFIEPNTCVYTSCYW